MKKSHLSNLSVLILGSSVLFLAACGKSPEASPAKEVAITANDQMKFDIVAIEASPGQRITVTLRNTGTMPKMSMGHNFVLLDGKTDPNQFIEASQTQMANDYVAPELKEHVVAAIKLLGPGESASVTFNAPNAPGVYPFLCSFPGHYAIGMKGTLTVQ